MPGKLFLVYRWIGVRSKPSRNLLLSTSCSSQLNLTVTSINSASRTCGSEIAPSGVRTASLDTSASVSKPFCRILSRSYFKGSVPTWPPERIENHRAAYVGDSQRANVCTAASGHYGSLKLVSNFVNVSHAIEWIFDFRVLSGIHRSSIFFVPSPVCRSYSTVASGFAAVHLFRKQIGRSFRGETTGFLSFNHMGQKASNLSRKDRQFQGSSSQSGKMDTVEVVVCTTEEVQDGQLKEVEVNDHKVLLVKENGQFYALGNKCTHYGAPLSKGSYCNGVVRCPWHGACFNVQTGDIEDFPGLDSVHSFQTEIRGKDVIVKANLNDLKNFRRVKKMTKQEASDGKAVVIVGGGPASVVCAETLRQEGFTGKITLVSKDVNVPYDRIKLSKTLAAKAEEIALRKADFYNENNISLLLGKQVTRVDSAMNQIVLDSGESLSYTNLLLATGGRPKRPNIRGSDLSNIFVLRNIEDANAIAEQFKEKHVVVLGSSFIGLEVACAMVSHAAQVSVVGQSAVPLANVFGPDIGRWLLKLHESKGVKFHNGTSISEFDGQDGKVTSVKLANGTSVKADVCVLGIGVDPCTEFLHDSGIKLTDRGYVSVDKSMQTNLKNVFAAGDITQFPLMCVHDKLVNIQHWQMAHQQGRIAALNIVGKKKQINSVPYFWTVQFGKSIRYAGYHQGFDRCIQHGEEDKFVAFYIKSDKVVAAASLGWDPIVSQFAQLLTKGVSIGADEVSNDPSSWIVKL